MSRRIRDVVIVLAMVATGACATPRGGGDVDVGFDVVEASIADIHAAMREGRLTAAQLVREYLARIAVYDTADPALNAIITTNPRALAAADSLDTFLVQTGGLVGPLHGIPVIVKDNYDTADLPTTAGSLLLAQSVPPDDAFIVKRLREAGAIVLAKSNMAEFAFSPYETVGSALAGHTRNPYAPDRVPAGSSGGTAAAVAASFGTVGLGTDTGNSIRGPSSHTALVGLRPTMGLTSRDGIVPLYLDRDVGGPMTRTVADAAAVLDVIAGADPADSVTALAEGRRSEDYRAFLVPDALDGVRIGVVRQLADTENADPEVVLRFNEALAVLRKLGAATIEPAYVPELDSLPQLWCPRFKTDIEDYLASLGEAAPVTTLDEIIDSGRYHPTIAERLRSLQDFTSPDEDPRCEAAEAGAKHLQQSLRRVLWNQRLDALVYPTWRNPPRRIGDLNSPHGNNSYQLAPATGFPAITVPMGYVADGLPVGLQFLGDAWTEWKLIALAYSYEQATRHRRAPPTTPPIPCAGRC